MPFSGDRPAAQSAVAALTSLHTRPGDELILADNSSVLLAAPGITVVRAVKEQSPAHARNVGAERATGDWILFLDADCRAPSDLLDAYFADPVADDVGQVVNPLIVDGQTHGGIAQGIGQALMEGVALDAANQVLTGSFMDYGFARAEDLPFFETALAEDPTTGNPLRIKGGGEGGVVPATAAVINALCDALGVDDIAMPATPERVWRALGQ